MPPIEVNYMEEQTSDAGRSPATARGGGLVRGLVILPAIVLLGLAVRLPFMPLPGHVDMQWFSTWAVQMHQGTVANAYAPDPKLAWLSMDGNKPSNYPPGYLQILRVTTALYERVTGKAFTPETARQIREHPGAPNSRTYYTIAKLPAVLADLATGVLLYLVLRRRVGWGWATAVAAFYLLQPGVIYNSARWGQVDAIHTFLLVLSLELASRRRYVLMGGVAALAVLIKLQSIALAPLWILCLVLGAGPCDADDAARPSLLERLHGAFTSRRLGRIAASTVLAVAVAVAICAPFVTHGAARGIGEAYWGSMGRYPTVTVNAFNLWGVLYPVRDFEGLHRTLDTTHYGGLSLRTIGIILLGVSTLIVAARVIRRPEALAALQWGGLTLCMAFYTFPTQIHERYLHPAIAIAAWGFIRRWWWWLGWLVVGGIYALNLMWVLPLDQTWPGRQVVERLAPQPVAQLEITDIPDSPLRDAVLQMQAEGLPGGEKGAINAPVAASKDSLWYPSRVWGSAITLMTVAMLLLPPRVWRDRASKVTSRTAANGMPAGDAGPS